jgi:hypothetical protein
MKHRASIPFKSLSLKADIADTPEWSIQPG